MNDQTLLKCPGCGEKIQTGWKICPLCETRLQPLACPGCGLPVKDNWKRCPACEARLICTRCSRRIPKGGVDCPECGADQDGSYQPRGDMVDQICGLEMVWVPGGDFGMGDGIGDGLDNERPVHAVRLDGYYIGRLPVTQGQWVRLGLENPSRFEGADLPVEQVTWENAGEFARRLTDRHKGRYRFSLPTEAQWEYAARSGGKAELYAGGDEIGQLAWYEGNSAGRTHPAGSKKPNGLGLHDMSGNVWEWCRDDFVADAYTTHAAHNPVVEIAGPDRVIRGGSWNLDAWSARCARRFSFRADLYGAGLGFRLVMLPGDDSLNR